MSDAIIAESIRINGHGGDEVEGYCARPLDPGRQVGGVVVIHHMPGYDDGTKEIARRLAYHGDNAIIPNLYWRQAPGASPDDAAATTRAQGGVRDEQLVDDVAGAAAYLKGLPNSNGKVGTLVHRTPDLNCPLLGLFGAEDKYPSPENVAELEEALKAAGKTYEFHSYPGAGHSFFSVNRPAYNVEAANDGWDRIFAFYAKYLSA